MIHAYKYMHTDTYKYMHTDTYKYIYNIVVDNMSKQNKESIVLISKKRFS